MLGLALLALHPGLSLLPIFAIAALFGASRAFLSPAQGAMGPMLVPREVLPRAIAWNSLGYQSALHHRPLDRRRPLRGLARCGLSGLGRALTSPPRVRCWPCAPTPGRPSGGIAPGADPGGHPLRPGPTRSCSAPSRWTCFAVLLRRGHRPAAGLRPRRAADRRARLRRATLRAGHRRIADGGGAQPLADPSPRRPLDVRRGRRLRPRHPGGSRSPSCSGCRSWPWRR